MAINCKEAEELVKLLDVVGDPDTPLEQVRQATDQVATVLQTGECFAGNDALQAFLSELSKTLPRLVEPWVYQVKEENLAIGERLVIR